MDKVFSEDIIKAFLEDKIYEKRGISKQDYILLCKTTWEKTTCPEGSLKIIIDDLWDYSRIDETTDYNDKILTEHLRNKKREGKLECHCLVKVKWENGDIKEVPWNEPPTQNLEDPIEPEERQYLFVLFDVLGFEHLQSVLGTTKLYKLYQNLIDKVTSKENFTTLQTVHSDSEASFTSLGNIPLRHQYFSDTIILWTPLLSEFISPFCARCADIVCESILMGLPLRGAISCGSAILNKNKGVFLGSPIVEAARVENQQNWIGVSFCPSATAPHFQLSLHPDLLIQNYIEHYKSSDGFNKYVSLMTLDWAKRAREKKIDEKIIKQLISLKSKTPFDKQIYYDQTLSFIQYSLDNNNWYKNYKLIVPKLLETIIKITLVNGDEIEGAIPDFTFKDNEYFEQYYLLVPKENIDLVRKFSFENQTYDLASLRRIMYVIPKKAISRQQLLRKKKDDEMPMRQEVKENSLKAANADGVNFQQKRISKEKLLQNIPKDLTGLNEVMSRIFIGAKGYDIFLPTLNTIHECARNLIFANYAIPEGETWNNEGMEILYKIELFSHRDFINAVDTFYKQIDLSKETKDFYTDFLNDYKKTCSTFIEDIDGLLTNYDPHFRVSFAPSIMELERFRLLGQMTKILCNLTQT